MMVLYYYITDIINEEDKYVVLQTHARTLFLSYFISLARILFTGQPAIARLPVCKVFVDPIKPICSNIISQIVLIIFTLLSLSFLPPSLKLLPTPSAFRASNFPPRKIALILMACHLKSHFGSPFHKMEVEKPLWNSFFFYLKIIPTSFFYILSLINN